MRPCAHVDVARNRGRLGLGPMAPTAWPKWHISRSAQQRSWCRQSVELARQRLERELAVTPLDDRLVPHPALPQRFGDLVAQLNSGLAELDSPQQLAAREAFPALIRQVVVTPAEERGRVRGQRTNGNGRPAFTGRPFLNDGCGDRI